MRLPVRATVHELERAHYGAYLTGSALRILWGRRALQLAWGADVLGRR